MGLPNARAAWFVRDVSQSMGRSEWRFFEAVCDLRLPDCCRLAPYRIVAGMPTSEALRGSPYDEGFVYQSAARVSALVFMLVSAWLTPTAGYGNRVMFTEAIARAIEACRRMMGIGPSGKWEVEKNESDGKPRSFNAALDNVAGEIVFGNVVSQTSDKAGMLQICLTGAAPNVGGRHFACPSDFPPWPTRQGSFVIANEVLPESRGAT